MIELWFLVNSLAMTQGQVQLEVSKHSALSSRGKVVWNQKEKWWLCACISEDILALVKSWAEMKNCVIALAPHHFLKTACTQEEEKNIYQSRLQPGEENFWSRWQKRDSKEQSIPRCSCWKFPFSCALVTVMKLCFLLLTSCLLLFSVQASKLAQLKLELSELSSELESIQWVTILPTFVLNFDLVITLSTKFPLGIFWAHF